MHKDTEGPPEHNHNRGNPDSSPRCPSNFSPCKPMYLVPCYRDNGDTGSQASSRTSLLSNSSRGIDDLDDGNVLVSRRIHRRVQTVESAYGGLTRAQIISRLAAKKNPKNAKLLAAYLLHNKDIFPFLANDPENWLDKQIAGGFANDMAAQQHLGQAKIEIQQLLEHITEANLASSSIDDKFHATGILSGFDFGTEVREHSILPAAVVEMFDRALPPRRGNVAQDPTSRQEIRTALMDAWIQLPGAYNALTQLESFDSTIPSCNLYSDKPAKTRGRCLPIAQLPMALSHVNSEVQLKFLYRKGNEHLDEEETPAPVDVPAMSTGVSDDSAMDTIQLPSQRHWTYKLPVAQGKAMEGRVVAGWWPTTRQRIRKWFEAEVLEALQCNDGSWQYKIKYHHDDYVELASFPGPKYCFKV